MMCQLHLRCNLVVSCQYEVILKLYAIYAKCLVKRGKRNIHLCCLPNLSKRITIFLTVLYFSFG